MKNLKFDVQGINCGSCIGKIESNLVEIENITEVKADKESQSVSVQGTDDLSAMKVKSALEDLGFPVSKMSKA